MSGSQPETHRASASQPPRKNTRGFSPSQLLLFAGVVWSFAGGRVCSVALALASGSLLGRWWFWCGAVAIFVLFFGLVFRPLFRSYSIRIQQLGVRRCPFAFFTIRGWATMVGMIALGICFYRYSGASEALIATFYAGLGSALFLTGVLFLRASLRRP